MRFEDEHEDEDDLVADFGVSSAERYAALCLCGESPFGVCGSEFGDGAAVFQPFGFLTQKWYGAKSTF